MGVTMNKTNSAPLLMVMAGGTGGHVFPGLAVAHHMHQMGWDVQWIGTADKMEAQLVPKHGFAIHFIKIGGMRGKSAINKLLSPFRLIIALIQSLLVFRRLRPTVVLGMGGYASGPGGIAAWLLNIPLVIHEQNAVFGMTNRYLARVARYTLTGFDLSGSKLLNTPSTKNSDKGLKQVANCYYVGNPIREEFFAIKPKNIEKNADVNILIVGGSLGALALNLTVPSVLSELTQKYSLKIKHQSGKGKLEQVKIAYENMPNVDVIEFIDNMQEAFDWSDIIICRSGALSVAEVAGAGRVAVFVPLPIAVDDHQTKNAKYLSEQQAAILIPQPQLEASLLSTLHDLCESVQTRINIAKAAKACAHKNATNDISSYIAKAANIDSSTFLNTHNQENRHQ
jgi:UDP-N-acetylglucosamine--N-acetylmuramyl-(pentapeptide) pyrophosphoryl-undecaprenol N-acetylglucosamine transferase